MNKETLSTQDIISAASVVNCVKRVLSLGLDVHYRQVTVAMQEDGGRIKAAGKTGYVDFLNWVGKKLAEGSGNPQAVTKPVPAVTGCTASSWRLGGENLVVVPKAMGQGGKKQKTDKRDAGELCDCLDRYLRGQDKALRQLRLPTEEPRAEASTDSFSSPDYGRPRPLRGSRQRLAVCSRHPSPWPLVAG